MPAVRMRSKSGLHVERVLADQHAAERLDQRNAALCRVGSFALPDDALVGVDAHVNLVAVHAHLGGPDVGDLQLGAMYGVVAA